ncbi:MAG: GIY-YIG nuclease family protein [Lachnospiraceae bacterium]|nr:GIY-YIG nuclease family protein [Lachnospiraceae bacterium]
MNKENDYCVYMVCCADNSLYTGIAVDVEKRIEVHNSGKGAKYTRSRLPVSLVYKEEGFTKSEALKRELEIKDLTRKEKEALIQGSKQGQ